MREGWLFPRYDEVHCWMLENPGESSH